jgi:tetratricopeptide (TPR) repeat protein
MLYDAFISYSHVKDKALAGALQSAMQRLGKPWYRRRALRLFRDDTSLTATPHLWPSIEQALGQSRFLILMASPEAAASRWVNQELAWWLEHKSADTVLIALTGGELYWDHSTGDFGASEVIPLPPALLGKFAHEPLWIDLRPYHEASRPRDARFTDLAAGIAAALHGRPKEDLLSQEVRQQRRALRLAGSAVAMLLVLLGLAAWQWRVAETQKRDAQAQRDRAERTLALATHTANGLVVNLAEKFRDIGVPAAITIDILARAQQLQDQLTIAGETSPELLLGQAVALLATAETQVTTGDISGALGSAKHARDIFYALLAVAPDSADFQQGLANSDETIGNVLMAQGDFATALVEYQRELGIVKPVAEKDPGNVRWQRFIAVINSKIGNALLDQGDLPGALAAYGDDLTITKALAAREPNNGLWQSDLAVSYDDIGNALVKQGDLSAALSNFRQSFGIRLRLKAADPDNTELQRALGLDDDSIGDALLAQDDQSGALEVYRNGLLIHKYLTSKDPGNTIWQRDLFLSYSRIGRASFQQGDLVGALEAFEQAEKIALQVKSANPAATTSASDLEWVRTALAKTRQKLAAAGTKN